MICFTLSSTTALAAASSSPFLLLVLHFPRQRCTLPSPTLLCRIVYSLSRYWVRSGRPSFNPLRFLVSWTMA